MRLRTKPRWFPLLLAALLAAGCASSPKPRKYKKKRGCDCPHWNLVPAAPQGAVHAGLPPCPPSAS
jgi:hypothetical protein